MFSCYHLVGVSPFPFFLSIVLGSVLLWGLYGFHYHVYSIFFIFLFFFIFILLLWFSSIEVEADSGWHSSVVSTGLRSGMVLFIVSEVMFFFGFFWSFFHNCWAPSPLINGWPPFGCQTFLMDPFGIPFLNTFYLLSSGVSITLCHHLLLTRFTDFNIFFFSWFLTIFYGLLFLDCQFEEYVFSNFSLSSGIFGSVFFLLTGFHGFHVLLGLFMLFYWFLRFIYIYDFSDSQHVSFEVAAWYWHFVDVVWLFLFVFVYWYNGIT